MFIYVLRLLSGKYYVGKTNNPSRRFDEHVEGEGSKWTALFKPMEVIMETTLTKTNMLRSIWLFMASTM